MRESQGNSVRYASFLVRLWREGNQEGTLPTATWHGEIEHIQSNQSWDFKALEELVNVLRRETERANSDREGDEKWRK